MAQERLAHLDASRTNRLELRDESFSSKEKRPQADRGIPLRAQKDPSSPVAFDAALGEVREYMKQYTQCADPSESAARKERLRCAEKEGQLERTAARMVRASKGPHLESPPPLAPFPPSTVIEEQVSAERMPAILRLGPPVTLPTENDEIPQGTTTKHKPGRPPGKKRLQLSPVSPKLVKGSSSKRRKPQQVKPPLPKMRTHSDNARGRTERTSKKGSGRGTGSKEDSTTNSDNHPICRMIPASTRRRVDFRNPPSLGP